jgi:hypothetical protein
MESPFELRISHAADWAKCGAFVKMNRTVSAAIVDAEQDHSVREQGTAMHWAAQWMRLFGHVDAVSAGTKADNGVELTDELIDGAAFYCSVLDSVDVDWVIERQLPAPSIHAKCGGTPDAYGFRAASAVIHVGDLKGGFVPVDVFPNLQLIGYLSAVLDANPTWYGLAQWVEFMIVQPRAFHHDGPVRKHRIALADCYPYIEELKRAAAVAMDEHAPAVAGSQCDNCAARTTCSVAHKAGMRALEISGEPVEHELTVAGVDYELQRIEEAARMLEARLTGLRAHAVHMIRNGQTLPHFAMKSGTGRLDWIDEAAEKSALAMGDLIGKNLRKSEAAITPTQAARLLPKDLIDTYATRRRGESKLVRFDSNAVSKAFSKLTLE